MRIVKSIVFFGFLAFFTPTVFAGDVVPVMVTVIDDADRHHLLIDAKYAFSSDVKAQPGDIQIFEKDLNYIYRLTDGELPLDLLLNVKHILIDEDLATALPSVLLSRGVGLRTKIPLPFSDKEHYFIAVEVNPAFQTATKDDFTLDSKSFRVLTNTYLIYKGGDNFLILAGVAFRSEYDEAILPIFGFVYTPNDRLSFNLASKYPNVSYKLTDETTLLWQFSFVSDEYEIIQKADKGRALRYQNIATGIGLKHAVTENVEISLNGGIVFNRNIEFRDGAGKVAPKPAPYVGLEIGAQF